MTVPIPQPYYGPPANQFPPPGMAWPVARPGWQPITQVAQSGGYRPPATQPPWPANSAYHSVHPFSQAQPAHLAFHPMGPPPRQPIPAGPAVGLPLAPQAWPRSQQPAWPPPIGARAAVKRPNWMLRSIVLVVVLLIAAPTVSAWIDEINDPTGQFTPPQPRDPTPTGGVSPPVAGRYTPGPPDTNPNDPPMPQTYDDVAAALEYNQLYSQNLPTTHCVISDIDPVNASAGHIEAHLNDFVVCLMYAWHDPVADAGFELTRPSVTVYSTEITTACGELPRHNAVYCTADQQIYYARNLIDVFPSEMQTMRFLPESIIGHEFAHSVQFRTMILISEMVLEFDALSEAEAYDYSRRLEMQADCFTGLFFNSVADSTSLGPSDEQNIAAIFNYLGSSQPYEDDHGSGTNRANWATLGLAATSPGVCGTFTVPSDQVA